MMQRILLVLSLALFAVGCYGPGKEAGDDPTRGDEGPMEGRPKTDPSETVDQTGPGGNVTSDTTEPSDDSSGTLDGTSDESAAPEAPR